MQYSDMNKENFTFRLTKPERDKLKALALQAGLKPSEWLREKIRGSKK